jgi:hypothetical protein
MHLLIGRTLDVGRDQITLDMVGSFYFNTDNIDKSVSLFRESYEKEATEISVLHLVSICLLVMLIN